MKTLLAAVSAPGKVLLAGGYLILDVAHKGLVIATTARFYCLLHGESAQGGIEENDVYQIDLDSPQFVDGRVKYELKLENEDIRIQTQEYGVKPS
jgi:phosphomevalonate kinase